MKPIISILCATFFVTLTACDQKAGLADKATTASKEAVQKVQESAQQTANEAAKSTKAAVKEVAEASKDSAVKSAAVVKETAEQALTVTSNTARDITKTQVSAPRQRAMSAEDEMKAELAKRK